MKLDSKELVSIFINGDKYVSIVFVLICFGAYLIPQWYAFMVSHPFIYTNAWDDANYLTYQGALGTRNSPGYYTLYIISWLQSLGISGAIQNLIFNTAIPPLTAFLLYLTFKNIGKTSSRAVFYSTCILFSSVIFNCCNPYIANYLAHDHSLHLIAYAWEIYPSIIRIPNPQLPYFILALFIYLCVKYKNKYFLLAPIPVLYYFVLAPYLFILLVYYLTEFINLKNNLLIRTIFINLISYVLLAFLVYVAFCFTGHLHYGANIIKLAGNEYYSISRKCYLPIVGLLGLGAYLLLKISNVFNQQEKIEFWFLTIICTAFAITNLQLINGFYLEIKTYQDYGTSILGGMLIVLLFETLHSARFIQCGDVLQIIREKFLKIIEIILKVIVIIYIAKFLLLSQGFSFSTFNFNVNLGPQFNKQQLIQIKKDPLHTFVVGAEASQEIPYAIAGMLAPPLSYQYNYPFVFNQCRYNSMLQTNALQYIDHNYNKNSVVRKDADDKAKIFFAAINKYQGLPFFDKAYCQVEKYSSAYFVVIQPSSEITFRYFPNWKAISEDLLAWL